MLITIVTSDPALWQPNPTTPYELEVDALQEATGAILWQHDPHGKRRPVGYDSKTFSATERNYPIWDQEFLAIICRLKHWRHLLMGAHHQVVVVMDHKNLQYFRSAQKVNRRIVRYILTLGDYHITLVHHTGATNKADALSQHPDYAESADDNNNVIALPDHLFINAVASTDLEQACLNQQVTHQATLNQ